MHNAFMTLASDFSGSGIMQSGYFPVNLIAATNHNIWVAKNG